MIASNIAFAVPKKKNNVAIKIYDAAKDEQDKEGMLARLGVGVEGGLLDTVGEGGGGRASGGDGTGRLGRAHLLARRSRRLKIIRVPLSFIRRRTQYFDPLRKQNTIHHEMYSLLIRTI